MNKFLYNRKAVFIRLSLYIIIPLVLLSMDKNSLDDISFCIIYNITGKKCISCGMSRAFFHTLHLDFSTAYEFNNLVVVYFPVFLIIILIDTIKMFKVLLK